MVIGSNILAGSSGQGGGYNISRSLRFRKSASAYLSRTFTSAGNRKTWTWSGWIKKSRNAEGYELFGSDYGDPYSNGYMHFNFQSSPADALNSDCGPEGSRVQANTTAIYRDPSAWYHIVIAFDTTQATSSNRIKYYVNGVQQTMTGNYPSQNYEGLINTAGGHSIGYRMRDNDRYFDGCMTEIHFIDGQALTPSSFGETSTTTGVWIPKRYTGTYGTNGFYLSFSDNTSTTTLGADSSGNGNNWTTNNISLTSGSTYDSMVDVPTQPTSSSDTYPPSNYAVFNPIAPASQTNSEANLKVSTAAVNATPATIFPSSGKWYAEIALVSGTYHRVGICNTDGIAKDLGGSANGWCYLSDGRIYNNGSTTSYGVSSTNGDIINIALDLDAGKIWYGKNGTWMSSGSPSTGANPSQTFTANQSMSFAVASGSGTIVYTGNFGQRPFAYTPPTGFVALNTYNLPTPTIGATASSQANKYFDARTYTGNNGSTLNVTGFNFQPDLVWTKDRQLAGSNHLLNDAVRGTNKSLLSNSTTAELTNRGVDSFNSDGFTYTSSEGDDGNYSTDPYIAWCWKANGTGVTNTAGSITSTVSANTTSGFSVVTYTETSGSYTVGHGLGVTPSMFILKERNASSNWIVWHNYWQSVDAIPTTKGQYLNSTLGSFTTGSNWLNSISSTTIGITAGQVTSGTSPIVMYAFAEVAGFSKFGSYTGNGSSDGTFVALPFKPAFILIKRTDGANSWVMYDNKRLGYNQNNYYVYAQSSNAEATDLPIDMLSNGFKIRNTFNDTNASGGNYIYMAFAENPFKYSLAR